MFTIVNYKCRLVKLDCYLEDAKWRSAWPWGPTGRWWGPLHSNDAWPNRVDCRKETSPEVKKEEKTPFKTKQTTICEISIKKFTEKIAKIKVSSCGGNRQENSFTFWLFSISSFLSNYSQQRTHLELVHLLTYFLTLKYKNCNFKVLTTNSTHMLECCIMT